jgi:hypothetical protein
VSFPVFLEMKKFIVSRKDFDVGSNPNKKAFSISGNIFPIINHKKYAQGRPSLTWIGTDRLITLHLQSHMKTLYDNQIKIVCTME